MVLEKWGAAWLGDREGRVAGRGEEWGAVRCRAGSESRGVRGLPGARGREQEFPSAHRAPRGTGAPGTEARVCSQRAGGRGEPGGGAEKRRPRAPGRERASSPGPASPRTSERTAGTLPRPPPRTSERTARARARAARMPVTSAPSAAAREPAPASRENRRQTAL